MNSYTELEGESFRSRLDLIFYCRQDLTARRPCYHGANHRPLGRNLIPSLKRQGECDKGYVPNGYRRLVTTPILRFLTPHALRSNSNSSRSENVAQWILDPPRSLLRSQHRAQARKGGKTVFHHQIQSGYCFRHLSLYCGKCQFHLFTSVSCLMDLLQ